jgi:hypothetical protein
MKMSRWGNETLRGGAGSYQGVFLLLLPVASLCSGTRLHQARCAAAALFAYKSLLINRL